jgi:hypothetical protein
MCLPSIFGDCLFCRTIKLDNFAFGAIFELMTVVFACDARLDGDCNESVAKSNSIFSVSANLAKMRCLVLLALLLLTTGALAAQLNDAFINDNVIRTIDLSSALVREKRAIAIIRRAGKLESTYYLAVELSKQFKNATVSLVTVKEKDSDKNLIVSLHGNDNNLPER